MEGIKTPLKLAQFDAVFPLFCFQRTVSFVFNAVQNIDVEYIKANDFYA